ncbi:type I-E CRISPR-associated protein Cas6/Cse3/CasE [Rhodococcus qingshengii]|uniref:type I-E CRISPR-associated protein Cas6/Cse3/CasE n=1 Tax=Rhodococcus qingshengii TaxID=334542 RepID=UPI0035DF0A4D
MTFLTKIDLSPWSSSVGYDLHNRQSMHERVMSMVPEHYSEDARSQAGVLFRLEISESGRSLLVQSRNRLDVSRLPGGYAGGVQERDLSKLLNWLAEGCMVSYRVDLHATVASKPLEKEGSRGVRRTLHGHDVEDWWAKRSAKFGLDLLPGSVMHQELPRVSVRKKSVDRKFSHVFTRCSGQARVIDAEALRSAIEEGVGKRRAYGAGLLSVAPMR